MIVDNEDNSSSFGEQWQRFTNIQIDSINVSNLREQRCFQGTGWTEDGPRNAVVLDAGCGSGRFTEIAS